MRLNLPDLVVAKGLGPKVVCPVEKWELQHYLDGDVDEGEVHQSSTDDTWQFILSVLMHVLSEEVGYIDDERDENDYVNDGNDRLTQNSQQHYQDHRYDLERNEYVLLNALGKVIHKDFFLQGVQVVGRAHEEFS